jgi:hypothetical protein
MHSEILTTKQVELLPYLSQYKRSFYLVGGTAISLHIGHRESIDFDLFTFSKLNKTAIKKKLDTIPFEKNLIFEDIDQIHLNINTVKVTFFQYPYNIEHNETFEKTFTLPDLLTLAAMKAFTLGRRTKWKDYVDLFFIIKNFYSVKEISDKAKQIFDYHFSEKLFIQQLAYHKDINYTEPVIFKPGFEVDADTVRNFLIDVSLQEL